MKTVKQFEKEYGVKLDMKGNAKLSTYLRRAGYPSLARILEKISLKG